jgi:putative oxidoreductase
MTQSHSTAQPQGLAAYAPAAGRVLIAIIFLFSAVGKITGPAGTIGYIASSGLPLPSVCYAIAVVVELFGGLALLVGYRVRIAALALALFSIAAAIGFHNNFADQGQLISFLKNLAIAGGLLQVVAFGAGAFSLDRSAGRA